MSFVDIRNTLVYIESDFSRETTGLLAAGSRRSPEQESSFVKACEGLSWNSHEKQKPGSFSSASLLF